MPRCILSPASLCLSVSLSLSSPPPPPSSLSLWGAPSLSLSHWMRVNTCSNIWMYIHMCMLTHVLRMYSLVWEAYQSTVLRNSDPGSIVSGLALLPPSLSLSLSLSLSTCVCVCVVGGGGGGACSRCIRPSYVDSLVCGHSSNTEWLEIVSKGEFVVCTIIRVLWTKTVSLCCLTWSVPRGPIEAVHIVSVCLGTNKDSSPPPPPTPLLSLSLSLSWCVCVCVCVRARARVREAGAGAVWLTRGTDIDVAWQHVGPCRANQHTGVERMVSFLIPQSTNIRIQLQLFWMSCKHMTGSLRIPAIVKKVGKQETTEEFDVCWTFNVPATCWDRST